MANGKTVEPINKEGIDLAVLPRHIGIIMDGNGRWAERQGVSRAAGHEAGAKSVRTVVEGCRELGVQYLTLYAFSTENWRRTRQEVNALFRLLSKYIRLELDNIHKEDIKVVIMGRREGLHSHTLDELAHCEDLTRDNQSMVLNVAINYGGRAELVDAAHAMARDYKEGLIGDEAFTEENFRRYLYHPEIPDLDLMIRTSGEERISNFMLWQVSYAEIVCMSVLWPDFEKQHLRDAIIEYQHRSRRFGGR